MSHNDQRKREFEMATLMQLIKAKGFKFIFKNNINYLK